MMTSDDFNGRRPGVKIFNPFVTYKEDGEWFEAKYGYERTIVDRKSSTFYSVRPERVDITLRTVTFVPRTGVMLVGWGGNNGSTLTAALIANRLGLTWPTKDGIKASTTCLGIDRDGAEVYVPLKDLLPLLNPNDIVLDGWDISSLDLAAAMERARVLDPNLQSQLTTHMRTLRPRASIFSGDFIASNQADRADNVLDGSKQKLLDRIRSDIREFKEDKRLDKVIVVWTANTERFCDVAVGLNDTADSLLNSIIENKDEVSPSTMFAVASILEGCAYVNGSPQNTFVPGVVELAEAHNVFIGGDDFKSGQTKIKSVLVDFLIGAGIKPTSIVSYNHLGNNDGKNLSAPKQFRSKEISKKSVVDDMVESNRILYAEGEKPDHCVVIKYVPYVGDSKRAMDEYTSEIMLGGHNTIVIHNTCEDSLLACPIILDLVVLTEICQRITFKVDQEVKFQSFHPVLSILSYLCKAPLIRSGAPVVNALFKQRASIENVFRACIGLPPLNHMALEHKLKVQFLGSHTLAADKLLNGEAVVIPRDYNVMRNGQHFNSDLQDASL